MVWCGVMCGVVWSGVVWCGEVWCGAVWCGVVRCGVVQEVQSEHAGPSIVSLLPLIPILR